MKKLFATILSLSLIIAPVPVVHASGQNGAYAKQILGIANSVIGTSIVTKCSLANMQPSLIAYMAGSLVYAMAEIAGGKDQASKQKSQDDQLTALKNTMKQGGDYQKGAIQAQIDDEKTTLKHVQKRRKWLMAVKVAYVTAMALAIWEQVREVTPPYIPSDAACKPNPATNKMMTTAIAAAYAGLSSFGGGGILSGAISAGAAGYYAHTFVPVLMTASDGAEYASLPLLNKAIGRIAFFGGASALVMLIDKDLATKEKESKKKISDLERVMNDFVEGSTPDNALAEGDLNGGTGAGNLGGLNSGSTSGAGAGNVHEITKLPDGVIASRQCFSNSNGAMEYSDSACKSPYRFTKPQINNSMKLPTLLTAANTTVDMGQAIADGDLGRAEVAAGSLSGMAGKLDSIRDGLLKKVNDKLVADGKKPIDINAELQRQVDVLNSAMNKNKAGSGSNTLASLGLDGKAGEASTSSSDTENANATLKVPSAPAQEVVALPENGINGFNENDLLDKTETSGGASNSDLDQMLNDRTGKLAALEKMDKGNGEGEIKQDAEASLFQQVSNRYFLNYSKIFERKKIALPEAPANQ